MKEIEKFRKYIQFEKRYSTHTVTSYINDLLQFNTFLLSNFSIVEESMVRHTHVRSWMVYLMQDSYNAKSINRKISTLKSYFKYLKKLDIVRLNPMSKVIAPKIPKRLPKVIREDALDTLFASKPEENEFKSVRNHLVIDLLYSTGMRRSELIGIKLKDLDLIKGQIKVLGKGNKERIIPIGEKLVLQIREYLEIRQMEYSSDYLLVSDKGKRLYPKLVYNIVKNELSKFSTSPHKSPHVLRHSFATHMANKGAELNSIKEILGHANLSATEIYMHNSIDRLKSVYKGAHPKSN